MAPTAANAATVMLLREGKAGPEVFMVERHHNSNAFAAMLVFPGGKVDQADADPALTPLCYGHTHIDEQLLAFAVAAVREAYEEAGVLLARDAQGQWPTAQQLAELHPARAALHRGELQLPQFLQQQQLCLALDSLVHFARWITPEFEPRRFDTHFYLAEIPPGQALQHDGSETVSSVWIRPQDALADAAAGRRRLIFPTLRNLERLAQYPTVAAALAGAQQFAVAPIQPRLEQRGDDTYLTMGQQPAYPVCEELISPELMALFAGKG